MVHRKFIGRPMIHTLQIFFFLFRCEGKFRHLLPVSVSFWFVALIFKLMCISFRWNVALGCTYEDFLWFWVRIETFHTIRGIITSKSAAHVCLLNGDGTHLKCDAFINQKIHGDCSVKKPNYDIGNISLDDIENLPYMTVGIIGF